MLSDGGYFAADKLSQLDEKIQAKLEKEDGIDRQLWIVLPFAEA